MDNLERIENILSQMSALVNLVSAHLQMFINTSVVLLYAKIICVEYPLA